MATIPDWLKAEIFKDLLKGSRADLKEITNFQVHPALPTGENYATAVLRIEIEMEMKDNTKDTKTFLIKLPLDNELSNELNKKRNVFECEFRIYCEVIPELEQMFSDAGLDVKFGAQCFKLPVEKDYVLLEDLKKREFKNAKRINGLDKLHLKEVLKKLAQWHAATATRIATKGFYKPYNLLMTGFLTEDQRPIVEHLFQNSISPFMNYFVRKPENEPMLNALQHTLENITDLLLKSSPPKDEEFNVLNHGDFWMNNIMFQYDEDGNIKETYIVDFQTCQYGSPAQDLIYLLISSAQYELKVKCFDYFILYYHQHLVEYLKLLNYPKKIPSLKDIHIALLDYSIWGVMTMLGPLATVNMENTECANLDTYLSDSEKGIQFKNDLLSNARFREHVNIVLPWLYNRGALESV